MIYIGIPRFIVLCFIVFCRYCVVFFVFFFLQNEGLWQFCIEHIYWCHFSNSICPFHVSVSHFGNSGQNFKLFHYCYVCYDLWSFMLLLQKRLWLPEGSDDGQHFLAIKYSLRYIRYCFRLNVVSHCMLLAFSCPIVSDSLWPPGLQHARPPHPSPSPRVCLSSCSLHWRCHPAISSSDPSSLSALDLSQHQELFQ